MQAMVGLSSKLYEAIKGIGGSNNIEKALVEEEILTEDDILFSSQDKLEAILSVTTSLKFNQVKRIIKESDFDYCFIFNEQPDDIETNIRVQSDAQLETVVENGSLYLRAGNTKYYPDFICVIS